MLQKNCVRHFDEILVDKGSIRDRLVSAAEYLARLKIDDVPYKNRADFAAVMSALTKYPAKRKGEGAIRASVRRLRKEEPAALARKIMSIFMSIYVDVSCAGRRI